MRLISIQFMNCNSFRQISNLSFPVPSDLTLGHFAYAFSVPSHSASTFSPSPLQSPVASKIERGKWSSKEQRLYIKFLQENSLQIQTKLARKANKIFKKMSQVIKSRTADQCRSHHQKIINYHESVERIISYYKNLLERGAPKADEMKQIPTTSNDEEKVPAYTISRDRNQVIGSRPLSKLK